MDAGVVGAVGKLTERWVRELPPGNTVVSALGLWPLLALLATAADEPGRSELAEAAAIDPDSAMVLAATDPRIVTRSRLRDAMSN